jgi:hypothetical protein
VGDDLALVVGDEDVLDVREVGGLHDELLPPACRSSPFHHPGARARLEGPIRAPPFSLSSISMFLRWVRMLSMVMKMKMGAITRSDPMITHGDLRIQILRDVSSRLTPMKCPTECLSISMPPPWARVDI